MSLDQASARFFAKDGLERTEIVKIASSESIAKSARRRLFNSRKDVTFWTKRCAVRTGSRLAKGLQA
ncbi:unnamed protein product [Sphagnum balticum]